MLGDHSWTHFLGPSWTCGLALRMNIHYGLDHKKYHAEREDSSVNGRYLLPEIEAWSKDHLGEWTIGLVSYPLGENIEQNEFAILFAKDQDMVLFKLMWPDAGTACPLV